MLWVPAGGDIRKDCPRKAATTSEFDSDALIVSDGGYSGTCWLLDSGASEHMRPELVRFTNYKAFSAKRRLTTAGGDMLWAEGSGNIEIMANYGREWKRRVLIDALYVPKIKFYLFSLSQALDKGCSMAVTSTECTITRGRETVAIGVRSGNLYNMDFANRVTAANVEQELRKADRLLFPQRLKKDQLTACIAVDGDQVIQGGNGKQRYGKVEACTGR